MGREVREPGWEGRGGGQGGEGEEGGEGGEGDTHFKDFQKASMGRRRK